MGGVILTLVLAAILVAVIVVLIIVYSRDHDEPDYKRFGRQGEELATNIIRLALRDDDRLLTNVSVEYDGKQAELDNVAVNKFGVFIFEVKNYAGYIVGGEDDFEWAKFKTTDAGNTYEKSVKNPIRQVKRQVYILAHFLDYHGARTWIEGFVFMLQNNSPVESSHVLNSVEEIDRAIHTQGRNLLDTKLIESIVQLLEDQKDSKEKVK